MRKVTGLLLAAALSVGSIATASAADMAVKARPAPMPTVYDWTGWHYGVSFGVADNRADWNYVGVAGANVAHEWDNVRVGLHGGHQYMIGSMGWGGIVFGIDYSASFPLDNVAGVSVCPNPAFACETRLGSLFTGGGRLGIGIDRFLVYGTGGYAVGQVKTRGLLGGNPAAPVEPTAEWQDGFYVGAGIDWMVFKGTGIDMLLGFEYKHVDLGTERHFPPNPIIGNVRDVSVVSDQFMAKASFKFNGPRFW